MSPWPIHVPHCHCTSHNTLPYCVLHSSCTRPRSLTLTLSHIASHSQLQLNCTAHPRCLALLSSRQSNLVWTLSVSHLFHLEQSQSNKAIQKITLAIGLKQRLTAAIRTDSTRPHRARQRQDPTSCSSSSSSSQELSTLQLIPYRSTAGWVTTQTHLSR